MLAILVESLYSDSSDADIYNLEVISRAILNRLIGIENSSNNELKVGRII